MSTANFIQTYAAADAGVSTPLGVAGVEFVGKANASLFSGAGGATSFKLQRSFDGGTTWYDGTDANGGLITYALTTGQRIGFQLENAAPGWIFRFLCTSYSSGTPTTQIQK